MSPTIIKKPKVDIAPELLELTKTMVQEESQVIVHCIISAPWYSELGIRIWPTTYLYDNNSDHRSELVHFENISPYPNWQFIEAGKTTFFTLFFSGLPKTVSSFDLIEEIPESNGFELTGIERNETDVYYVRF